MKAANQVDACDRPVAIQVVRARSKAVKTGALARGTGLATLCGQMRRGPTAGRWVLLATTALAGAACTSHPAVPAFRSLAQLPDRGIAVPIPPPSALAIPEEPVEATVFGNIVAMDDVAAGTVVHVEDTVGGDYGSTEQGDGEVEFEIAGIDLLLLDHCLELWVESPDGRSSETSSYHAEVEVDDAGAPILDQDGKLVLLTADGCVGDAAGRAAR